MVFIQNISALKTTLGRQLEARKESEGLVLGDWCFQVGTGGFNPASPTTVLDVDPGAQALTLPTGGLRWLGRVLLSGAGASVAYGATAGTLVVSGLAGMPNSAARRWLRLFGHPSGLVNGTWFISRWLSATSVEIYNPLPVLPADVAGTCSWDFREAAVQYPNYRAVAFQCRLLLGDANNEEIGQVGIWGRVLASPVTPALKGLSVLYCVGHFPPFVKVSTMVANLHIVEQF